MSKLYSQQIFTMCFLSDWPRADVINFWIAVGTLLTALLTAGLLFIAVKAYNKFLSDEALKRQLDVVLQLIQELQSKIVRIVPSGKFIKPGVDGAPDSKEFKQDLELGSVIVANIFQLGTFYEKPKDLPLLIEVSGVEFLRIKEFFHPLIPANIISCWKIMYDKFTIQAEILFSEIPDKFYLVGKSPFEQFIMIFYKYEGGLLKFIDDAKKLHKSIVDWLTLNRITKINNQILGIN